MTHYTTTTKTTARPTTRPRRRAARFPNAAERSYYIERLTDAALGAAICVGLVVMLFYLATM